MRKRNRQRKLRQQQQQQQKQSMRNKMSTWSVEKSMEIREQIPTIPPHMQYAPSASCFGLFHFLFGFCLALFIESVFSSSFSHSPSSFLTLTPFMFSSSLRSSRSIVCLHTSIRSETICTACRPHEESMKRISQTYS